MSSKTNDVLKLDNPVVSMVVGMLDTASVPREPVRGR